MEVFGRHLGELDCVLALFFMAAGRRRYGIAFLLFYFYVNTTDILILEKVVRMLKKIIFAILIVSWCIVIFMLSNMTSFASGDASTATIRIFVRYVCKIAYKLGILATIMVCFGFSLTDEFHQSFVGRNSLFTDCIIDTSGATISVGIYCLTRSIYQRFLVAAKRHRYEKNALHNAFVCVIIYKVIHILLKKGVLVGGSLWVENYKRRPVCS